MKMRARAWCALVAIIAGSVMASACGARKSADEGNDHVAAQNGSGDDGDDSSGSGFGNLDFIGSMLARQLDEPGPYDEPRASRGFEDDEDHFAIIELSGSVVEMSSFSFFGSMDTAELGTIRAVLRSLGANEHVKGILLRAGELGMSMATAEELRAELIALKGNGARKLVCHTEGASSLTYYVLSACDSIGLAPTGGIVISGVAAMPIHVKGLIDKMGLTADFLQVGEYKGAAEPLTRESPSEEMRKTIGTILDRSYATMVAGIAEGRRLAPVEVEALIDKAIFQGEEATHDKLVDAVAVYEAYRDATLAGMQWTVVKLSEADEPNIGKLMHFVGLMPRSRPWQPHVALVYAVGNIIDGRGEGIMGARQEIASRTMAAALRALAADDNVKAVVLRIDSGGGSALASELIWHAVAEIKAKKPVVVSMAGMAASGGYYIACGANKVFAMDNTLTGSIGVVGGKLALRGAMDKLGVKAYPMGRGKRALIGSMVDTWNQDERSAIQQMMQGVYKTFVDRVAAGRGKSFAEIDEIARGRVWTGTDAKKLGLVDEIGGLDAALAEARRLGDVDEDVDLEVYPPAPTLIDLLGSFGSVSAPHGLSMLVDELIAQVGSEVGMREARAVADLLGQLWLLRDSRVLTAAFFPMILQ